VLVIQACHTGWISLRALGCLVKAHFGSIKVSYAGNSFCRLQSKCNFYYVFNRMNSVNLWYVVEHGLPLSCFYTRFESGIKPNTCGHRLPWLRDRPDAVNAPFSPFHALSIMRCMKRAKGVYPSTRLRQLGAVAEKLQKAYDQLQVGHPFLLF